jgi:hypothetical protein
MFGFTGREEGAGSFWEDGRSRPLQGLTQRKHMVASIIA